MNLLVGKTLPCDLLFHQKCFDVYTHSSTLKRIEEREQVAENEHEGTCSTKQDRRSSVRKRDRLGNFLLIYVKHNWCCEFITINQKNQYLFPWLFLTKSSISQPKFDWWIVEVENNYHSM